MNDYSVTFYTLHHASSLSTVSLISFDATITWSLAAKDVLLNPYIDLNSLQITVHYAFDLLNWHHSRIAHEPFVNVIVHFLNIKLRAENN